MSAYPDNVIVLDDYRRNLPEYSYEPCEIHTAAGAARISGSSPVPTHRRSRSDSRCSCAAP